MNEKNIVDPIEKNDIEINVVDLKNENVVELNNDIIDELKNVLIVDNMIYYNNKDIINDKFDDDVEFIIDDEILIDVENDIEFIKNIIVLCIINYYKGSLINDDVIDKLNYYIYNRFININNEFIKNLIHLRNENKNNYSYEIYKNNELIDIYVNYNIINLLHNLLIDNDIFIDEFDVEFDVNIKNKFILDQYYLIDDILLIDENENIIKNYNDVIECIYVYNENDVDDDIDELFEINDNLRYYINYEKIIDDLIIDNYYYEFKYDNEIYYIHNSYF